jgi:solute carrier family 25 carnitine/acylcarnitine transporter 20/29
MQKEVGGKHRGSLEAGRDIYRRFGLRGLYLGFNSTLLREVKANAVYFYSYEYIMRFFAPEGEGSGKAPIMAAFLAGGLAGCNSWLLTYPVDYVKTLMQSQNLEKLRWKSSWDCAVQQYKAEGYRTFFKGLGITLLRSFPVNGVAFFSYEFVMRRMGWKK